MATPKNKPITVNEEAYGAFIDSKHSYMKAKRKYGMGHSKFMLLVLAKFKKEVN